MRFRLKNEPRYGDFLAVCILSDGRRFNRLDLLAGTCDPIRFFADEFFDQGLRRAQRCAYGKCAVAFNNERNCFAFAAGEFVDLYLHVRLD